MKVKFYGTWFNTDTAKVIGTWDSGYPKDDINHVAQTLYKRRNGTYFLHNDHNGLKAQAKNFGNPHYEFGAFEDMSATSAKRWLLENDPQSYGKEFK